MDYSVAPIQGGNRCPHTTGHHGARLSATSRVGTYSRSACRSGGATSGSVAGSERRGKASSLAYVGCYTPNGLGIYLFRVEADGDRTPIKVFTTPSPSPTSVSATNPSWLSFNPHKTHLYVANEIGNFNGTTASSARISLRKSWSRPMGISSMPPTASTTRSRFSASIGTDVRN